jgi:hypothetical protein
MDKTEKKINDICKTVATIETELAVVKALLVEKGTSELLRNDQIQDRVLDVTRRVQALEEAQLWISRSIAGLVISIIVMIIGKFV